METTMKLAVAWRPPLAHKTGIQEEGMVLTWRLYSFLLLALYLRGIQSK